MKNKEMNKVLYYDFCAIVILTIIMVSNFTRGYVKGRTNKFFSWIVVMSLVTAVSDFFSGYGTDYFTGTDFEIRIMYVLSYIYFFVHSNIAVVYALYCFNSMGIWHKCIKNKLIFFALLIPTAIVNLSIFISIFNHTIFYISDTADYVRGPLIAIVYICVAVVFLVATLVMLYYRNMVRRSKLLILLSMLPINLIAIVIQALNPNMLLESFFLAAEMVVFVLTLQRAEEYRDPRTGAKKYNIGADYIKGLLKAEAPFGIILFKMHNSKNIRMYLGREAANELIRYTSDAMGRLCRWNKMDTQIYYLNDGLWGMITEDPDMRALTKVANSLNDMYAEKLIRKDYEILVDAKIVVINCPEDISDYDTLLTFAQNYHLSMPDTHKVMYYSEYSKDRDFILKNELSTIIKRGLEEHNFSMYYQPIYSTKLQRYVAAEALLRLNDPEFGEVSPSMFIPAAEASGDMHDIGDFVMDEVCRYYSLNNLEQYGIDYIQVNLSPSQCIEVDLVNKIKRCMEHYRLAPDRISLELTEYAADIEPQVVDENVAALGEYGIHFALDDYGTGYSNIKRVTQLPIEMVKLDRSFISNLSNPDMQIIVEDTILMLQEMGKEVLVSGIEDAGTADRFASLGIDYIQGCEYMQGFYFCRPIPGDEFLEFLKNSGERFGTEK